MVIIIIFKNAVDSKIYPEYLVDWDPPVWVLTVCEYDQRPQQEQVLGELDAFLLR